MFWFFDNDIKINTTSYNFLQIFNLENTQIESDDIFKLDSDNFPLILEKDYNEIIIKKKIKPKIINYCVKIIGKNISWTDLTTLSTKHFIQKKKFIKPNENKFKLPIFEFSYETVTNKMPELTSESYDFYYPNIEFELYKIDNNLILVKEFDKANNVKMNYILSKKTFLLS